MDIRQKANENICHLCQRKFYVKIYMVSDNKVCKSWFLFVSSKRGAESSSHSMTHGLIIMPTKAMSTGRSFKNKTDSSIQQQQVLMPPPASNAPWLLQKPLGKLTFSTGHLGILSETGLLYSLLCYLSLKNLSSLALLPELSAICILSTCHLFFLANNLTIENGKTKCS